MKSGKRETGFTLIEMLIVIAIIAILAVIGFGALNRLVSQQRTVSAQHTLAQLLTRARSDARRTSSDQNVTWNLTSKPPTFTLGTKTTTLENVTVDLLSDSATLITSISYEAPMGRRSNASNLQFAIKNSSNYTVYVKVIGLTGKVVRDGG